MINTWLEVPEVPELWVGTLYIDIPKGYTLQCQKENNITSIQGSVAEIKEQGYYTFWYTADCDQESAKVTCLISQLPDTEISIYSDSGVYYCTLSNDGDIYYWINDGKKQLYTKPFVLGKQESEDQTGTIYTECIYGRFSVKNSKDYTIEKYDLGTVTISPSSQVFSNPIQVTLSGNGDIYYKINNEGKDILYTEPFTISKDTEITYWNDPSNAQSIQYIYLPVPVIYPDTEVLTSGSTIEISGLREQTIGNYIIYGYYSIDDSEELQYTNPFTISNSCTIKATNVCTEKNTKIGSVSTERYYTLNPSNSQIIVQDINGGAFGDENSIVGYNNQAIIKVENATNILYRFGSNKAYSKYVAPILIRMEDASIDVTLEVLATVEGKDIYRKLIFHIIKTQIPQVILNPNKLDKENAIPGDDKIDIQNIPEDITVTYKWSNEPESHTTTNKWIPLQEGTVSVTVSSDYYIGTSSATGEYIYKISAPFFDPGYQDYASSLLGDILQQGGVKIFGDNVEYRYKYCSKVQLASALEKEDAYSEWEKYTSPIYSKWLDEILILEARSVSGSKYSDISKIYYMQPAPELSLSIPKPEVYPPSGKYKAPITCTMIGKYTIMYNDNQIYTEPIDISESTTITAWQVDNGKPSNKVIREYDI